MGKFIVFVFVFLFSTSTSGQEVCYSLGKCVNESGEHVGSEIVPQTVLSKCEDKKARSNAVPGLILAERKELVAVSRCSAALEIFGTQLTAANEQVEIERDKRISAEKKTWIVGIVSLAGGVIVTLLTVFLVGSASK